MTSDMDILVSVGSYLFFMYGDIYECSTLKPIPHIDGWQGP